MNHLTRLVGLSLVLATSEALAQNRTFTSQYTFGDSLSDDGNLFALTQRTQPPPPYVNGRFSNGPVYAELLGNAIVPAATISAKRGNLDFAYGGATAGAGGPVPNLAQQIAQYQLQGLPAARTDLFTVLIGANDLIPVLTNPAAATNPSIIDSAGVAAAQSTAASLQTLVNLGAKNILIAGLPNLGDTPRSIAGGTTGVAFGQRASAAFNNELTARVRALAASAADVNFTYVDLQGIVDRLVVDYKLLGYTNATSYVIASAALGGGGDPNGYVFFDDIHPTAKTHALLAAIVTEELNPEPVVGFAGTEGTAALALESLAASALDSRLAKLASTPRPTKRADAFASFHYGSGDRVVDGLRPKFSYDAQVVTVGVDSRLCDGFFGGGALDTGRLHAKITGGGSFTIEDQTGRLYGVWRGGPVAFAFDGGYGVVSLKGVHRPTAFGGFQTDGKASGSHWGAGLVASWNADFGGVQLRPWLGFRTERVKLDAYTEKNVPALSMAFDAQNAKSSAGSVGFALGSDTVLAGRALHFDFSTAWHGEFGSRTRNVSGRLADNFTHPTVVGMSDGDGRGFEFAFGGTLSLAKNLSASLGYAGDVRQFDKLASRVAVSLQTGF